MSLKRLNERFAIWYNYINMIERKISRKMENFDVIALKTYFDHNCIENI